MKFELWRSASYPVAAVFLSSAGCIKRNRTGFGMVKISLLAALGRATLVADHASKSGPIW